MHNLPFTELHVLPEMSEAKAAHNKSIANSGAGRWSN